MKNNNTRKVFAALTMILQFGLNMIVPIVMCTLLGVWLGRKYDIPIITVPLFIIGALAGFTNIFKMAKKIYQQDGETEKGHVKEIK
jgi:F0F1-type ATP synthase assembly protein I